MNPTQSEGAPNERGFGLVEVIVAMALLLIVAVSILPIFISSLRLSETNVSLATATQIVSEQMDIARGLSPTCAAVKGYAAETIGLLITDPKGNVLEIHRSTAAACPAPGAYPAAFVFTAWVTKQGESEVLAYAETRIHITGDLVP